MANKKDTTNNLTDKPLNKDGNETTENDITPEERALLDSTDENSGEGDDELLDEARLDDTDEDGEPLNENDDDVSGNDLDVPGADADNADEEIGEEDEENNDYSGAEEQNE
jgi:hypothetical protein